jgi:peptide/nickel transport system permease protein
LASDVGAVWPGRVAADTSRPVLPSGRRNRAIWVSAGVLLLIGLAGAFGPWIGRLPAPVGGDIAAADLPIGSAHHLLGTDLVGNDVLARVLVGGRVSLEVAVGSNLLGLVVGGTAGICAGYLGGVVDAVASVSLDVLIGFPALVLALVIATGLGPGELHVVLALAFFSIPAYARLARAAAARLRREPFVSASELAGAGPVRVVLTHLVPNIAPQLLTFAGIGLSVTVVLEASLSFLGVGIRPPAPSWGGMIVQGQEYLAVKPSLVLVPAAFLSVTTIALNVLGAAVRERLAER